MIGDTQGRYKVETLLGLVAPHFAGVDEIWHAGDWQDRAVLDGLARLCVPLVVVNGNAPDDPSFPERLERSIEGLRVGMVHRPPRAGDTWAAELDVCIHGHTHRWRDETVGRTRFLNVATPTAAGFSSQRTIGVLNLDAGAAELRKIVLAEPGQRA